MIRALFLLVVLVVGMCSAEDITLADGTLLRDARVVRKDDDSAIISHSEGVQRVKFDRLLPDLQQKLDLTPQAVQMRREQARLEKIETQKAQEKLIARQREALAVSKLTPRYLSGADVLALFSSWETLSAATAEYLAAEWNRREALRCNLTVEAENYEKDAQSLAARMEEERQENRRTREKYDALNEELARTRTELKTAQDSLQTYKKKCEQLTRQQALPSTVVISEPTYVPIYRNNPIVLPPIRVRPAPPPPRPPAWHLPPNRPPAHGPMDPKLPPQRR